jgi:hypothetical protein
MIEGTPCIPWTGAINNHGYGRRGRRYAHRMAWEEAHGPIPHGMKVCHHCDTPACVNIEHLFLGTQSDNMRDCAAKGRLGVQRRPVSHCKRGHPYDETNTYVNASGQRTCRACRNLWAREHYVPHGD